MDCPKLCPHCAHPGCLNHVSIPLQLGAINNSFEIASSIGEIQEIPRSHPCRRSWIRFQGLSSFSARYLLSDKSLSVLKKWKTRRGLFFDQKILKLDDQLLSEWSQFDAQAIIPIPQSFHRSWKMKGSPALRIARWVGQSLNIPVLQLLENTTHLDYGQKLKRQAELTQIERFQQPLRFSVRTPEKSRENADTLLKNMNITRVILVDDFMTTGRTLQQAALAFQSTQVSAIHGFCLGIRVHSSR
jgi:predicted amidophosphoribosyltransferase